MDVAKFIQQRVATAGRYVLPSIRQLLHFDEHGEPVPVGSAVLVSHRGQRYLVSAAHVFDVFLSHPPSIGTATKWHTVTGDFRATRIPRDSTREDDPLDYAFMLLSDADADALDGCHFLTGDQVALREDPVFTPPIRSKYLAIGWPLNRLNFDRKKWVTEPKNIAFTGVLADKAAYAKHDRRPNTHLLLELDAKGVLGPKGRQRPPSFKGMSGGGIFTMPGLQRIGDVSPPRLVGLTTEFWAEHDLFVGVRIDIIFAAMDAAA